VPDLSPFELTGKVAVVTGGNGGIGLGIAMGLAGAGANIVVAARSVEKTAQALEDIRALSVEAHGITVDVTQEPAIQRMVTNTIDHMGRLDILVNNSGIAVRAQPQDLTAAQWDSVVDVNLRAAFLASKEVYSHMVSAGGGKVINVGSMYSLFGSDWGAPYAASKAGLVQLTKSLAVAWAKDNIQVNAVLPGWFVTDLTRGIPDADLIQYREPLNLANLFRLFGKSDAKAIKIDLGVDLPKLKSGRLYFLSPLLLY